MRIHRADVCCGTYLVLHRMGFAAFHPLPSVEARDSSLWRGKRAFQPLATSRPFRGGALSVTLRYQAVSLHPALRCPDFPHPRRSATFRFTSYEVAIFQPSPTRPNLLPLRP